MATAAIAKAQAVLEGNTAQETRQQRQIEQFQDALTKDLDKVGGPS
jgi:hypothetical protein